MIRRTSIVCLEVLCGIAVAVGVLAAVSAWRLSQGPVSLHFLLPYADDLVARADSPFHAEMEDLILTWAGWERALDVRAVGMRLIDKQSGRQIAKIGEMSISLSIRALVRGEIALTSLELIRPLIRLTRTETGTFRFGMGEPDSQAEEATDDVLALLLSELSSPVQPEGNLRYLTRASAIGAVLRVEDQQLGVSWGARHADVTVERAPIGLRATFDLDLDLQKSQAGIDGEVYFNRAEKFVEGAFSFDRLNPDLLGRQFSALTDLQALQSDLSGDVDMRIGLDGVISKADFKVTAGSGRFSVPGQTRQYIDFTGVTAEGGIDRNPDRLQIRKLTVNANGIVAALKGSMTRTGDFASLTADLALPSLPVSDLGKFWPRGAADGARSWVVANMRDGTITAATAVLKARLRLEGEDSGAVEVDSINGKFLIDDTTVDYLAPLPPITNASANATFSDKRFDFDARAGRIGDLTLKSGTLKFSDLGAAREMLAVDAKIEGPVRDALELIAHPRLNLLSRVGLNRDGAEGTQTTQLKISFPLLNDLKVDDIRVSASSALKGLALSSIIQGHGISDGNVSLDITNDRSNAEGTVSYAGTPTRFRWKEDFSGTQAVKRRLEAGLTADERLRAIFNLDHPEILSGPVSLNLIYEDRRDGSQTLSAGLNLKDAKFSVPGFDWAKQPGREGTAKVTALFKGNTITAVPRFNIHAGVFSTEGSLTVVHPTPGEDPVVETLILDKFALGSTAFAAEIRRAADRSFDIAVSGRGFDFAPFIGQDLGGVDTPKLPPFTLNGKFAKFWIGPGPPTNEVRIKLRHDGARWQEIVADGELPDGGKAFSVNMRPTSGGHELTLYSADAGVLLKATDVTDTIRGGSIEISGIRKGGPDAPWNGTAEMKRFRVINAPNLARIATLASISGIDNAVKGEGIVFDRLQFPFVFEKETAEITDALAVGSELGVTISGRVDFAKDEIDLNGTIIPAYTINSVLGKVPLLGPLITGDKGGGIFAASYKVRGPVEKPEIAVNPLSAFAPGFTRKFFGGGDTSANDGKTPDQEERQREEKQNRPVKKQ